MKKLRFWLLAASLLCGCSWWQKHESGIECAALAAINHAAELRALADACRGIVDSLDGLAACLQPALQAGFTAEAVACFGSAAAGTVICPAYATARPGVVK